VHFELEVVNRDFSIGVSGSIHTKAEDIFHRLERWSDFKFSKERPLFFQRSLKTKIRDFLGSGVNLTVVILVDFLPKDQLGRFDLGDIFSGTGSNQVVLCQKSSQKSSLTPWSTMADCWL